MPEIRNDPGAAVLLEQQFIQAPRGRGEELRLHLASHGITARLSHLPDGPYERLELEGQADPVTVRAVLDHWER